MNGLSLEGGQGFGPRAPGFGRRRRAGPSGYRDPWSFGELL